MNVQRHVLAVWGASALVWMGAALSTAAAENAGLSGSVIDNAGLPVAGATVEYWRYEQNQAPDALPELAQQVTTGVDGAFHLSVSQLAGVVLAQKPGLAPAWQMVGEPFNQTGDLNAKLVLTPPGTLAGSLMDESNRPVADAKVSVAAAFSETTTENGGHRINSLGGPPAARTFFARTDAAGRFSVTDFPTNAAAVFKLEVPGRALRAAEFSPYDVASAGYHAGDPNIKLIAEPAGIIEGRVISLETNQAPPPATLTLAPEQAAFPLLFSREPVQARADGTFRFDDVRAGAYQIRAVFSPNPAGWVAQAARASVSAGEQVRDVEVRAQLGALLLVSVTNEQDQRPLAKVNVTAYRQGCLSSAVSDTNGLACLTLAPGDYQIQATRAFAQSGSGSATVVAGLTNHAALALDGPRKISGVVRQPDGRPAAALPVQLVGAFGGGQTTAATDDQGRFEFEWNVRQFPGQGEATACVLVRDASHDLAAAQDVEEDTAAVDLKLAPALTLAGRAECDGKPLANATAQLVFWTGNRGMWLSGLASNNSPGQYEIRALPPGRKYGLIVSAPGYGQKQLFNFEVSAEPGRQTLDPVELLPANLRLAGQVLDANDQPVPGCDVNLNGDGQPNGHTRSDREGRFAFANVCDGPVGLFANGAGAFGSVSAEGGDTNVVLHLGRNASYAPDAQTHKLKGRVTDDQGAPDAGAQVAVLPNNGTRWVKAGSGGEFSLTWSLQSWQAQNGGAHLVARDPARNLASIQELPDETTNVEIQLKPALCITGQAQDVEGKPLPGAEAGLWIKTGNNLAQLDDQARTCNTNGGFEFPCLPLDGQFTVWASTKGYGRTEQPVHNDSDTNRVELPPLVLKRADQVIAGQVLRNDDKPAGGVNVNLSGEGQPDGSITTDREGRFHFRVCEGQIRLFVYSSSGGGTGQAGVEAGDTNIVINLSSSPVGVRETPRRSALRDSPLPDLATVSLAADAVPAGHAVLLCLFDASQRPSRHVLQLLEQRSADLRQKNVSAVGVQAVVITDDVFNAWKGAASISFPVGRITEKNQMNHWATSTSALPWLILTDMNRRVVAEGFSLDQLDEEVLKLSTAPDKL